MIFDTHMHTKYSFDSKMELTDAIKAAENLDLGIIITEHHENYFKDDGSDTPLDADKYFEEYEKYRSEKVLLGVELGLSEVNIEENKRLAGEYPFDYCLGSLHGINGYDIYMEFSKGLSSKLDYGMYLDKSVEMVLHNDFDALGHIDYPSRISRFPEKDILFSVYKEKYDTLFHHLIDKNILLEINTRRLHNPETLPNLYEVYGRYYELGGKYITLASDAHSMDAIGKNIDIGLKMAKDIGLMPVYFEKRKMKICSE